MRIRLGELNYDPENIASQHLASVTTARNHILAHVAFCMRNKTNPGEAETRPTGVVNGRKAVNIRPDRKVDRIIISYPLVAILKDFLEDTASYMGYEGQLKLAKKYKITNLGTVYRIASKLGCVEMLEWKHINLSVEKFEKIRDELDTNSDQYQPNQAQKEKKGNGDAFFRLMEKLGLSNPEYLYGAISALGLVDKLGFSKIKITSFDLAKRIRKEIVEMVGGNHGYFTETDVFQIAENVGVEEKNASKIATVIRAFGFHSDNISKLEA